MPDIMELIEKFAHPDDEDVNESLVRALEATDTSDRKAAVDELVALNDLHAASRIFWVILNGSKHARLAAVDVLGELRDPFGFFYLGKALKDPDPEVRIAVIEAFEKLGEIRWKQWVENEQKLKDSIDPLAWILEDSDEFVRKAAIGALVKLKDVQAIWVLIGHLIYGSEYAREAAAQVIDKLAEPQSPFSYLPPLFNGNKDARKYAAEVLSKLNHPLTNHSLKFATGDSDGDVRISAADALAGQGKTKWKQWIKGDKEDFARMGKSGDKDALESIIRALGSSNDNVRNILIDTLISFGDHHAVDILIQVLIYHFWDIRIPVAEVLGELGDPRAVDPLIEVFLTCRVNNVRIAATKALGKLGDQRAVEPLTKALGDLNGDVYIDAIEALKKLGAHNNA